MPRTGLQFDAAPPVWVPLRFLLSAPAFLALAAATMLWRGPEALQSRLSPSAIALTHLFTLGFMSMVMIGALMQLLPVAAGAPIARPRTIAAIIHAGLTLGTLALCMGLLVDEPRLSAAGGLVLSIALTAFVAAAAAALRRASVRSATTLAMKLATLALLAAVALGLTLALARGLALPLRPALRELHPAWGLLGWLGLLSAGVAYQVVPMFQTTPPYPAAMRRYFLASLLAILVLWSVASWVGNGDGNVLSRACGWALAGAGTLFAAVTLRLQHRRRRREGDATLAFWRVGMASLLLASLLWAVRIAVPQRTPASLDVLLGVLALPGFAGSIINGMLYKIAPFLAWLHLQSVTRAGRAVPSMKAILGEADQRRQLSAHVAALVLLAAAAVGPAVLVYPAAAALGASALLLGANLFKVVRSFQTIPQLQRSARRRPAIALPHEEKR